MARVPWGARGVPDCCVVKECPPGRGGIEQNEHAGVCLFCPGGRGIRVVEDLDRPLAELVTEWFQRWQRFFINS